MTDQQQIEIWRKEAENYIDSLPTSLNDWTVDDVIKAYIAAKRSMPVIDLPDMDDYFERYEGFNGLKYESDVHSSITAAGYQYRIKGE